MVTDSKVKSLEKSLKILECFNSNTPDLGIAQIAEMLSLSKSNVHNIVSTFEKLGYLEQDIDSKRYRLGMKLLEYTYLINKNLSYQKAVHQIISEVSNETGFVVYFAIPKVDRIFYLNNAHPFSKDRNTPYRLIMGETAPYHCTSLGKGMLAFFDSERIEEIIKLPRDRFTPKTLLGEKEFRSELEKIKDQGYAIDDEEHELGIKCMGMPIISRNKGVAGAISISTNVANFDDNKLGEYYKILVKATQELKDLM